MVVTKDLSRLGRNYVQSGLYIETYFPEHEVRFVAILDNIDTAYDTSNNDIAPFKSILNEMYAKDTSKKINSVLQSKRNLGEYLGTAPYGYKKDPENKYHLIIDEEVKNMIVEKGTDRAYGARPLRRAIQTMIEDKIADEIIKGNIKSGDKAKAKVEEGNIIVEK